MIFWGPHGSIKWLSVRSNTLFVCALCYLDKNTLATCQCATVSDEFFRISTSSLRDIMGEKVRGRGEQHTQIGQEGKPSTRRKRGGGRECVMVGKFVIFSIWATAWRGSKKKKVWKLYDRESRHIRLDLLRSKAAKRRNWILNSESLLWCVHGEAWLSRADGWDYGGKIRNAKN